MRAWHLFMAVMLLTAAIAAVVLLDADPRRAGTNNVPPLATVARLAPDAGVCQDEDVPPDTATIVAHVGPPRRVAATLRIELTPIGGDGPSVSAVARAAVDGTLRFELSRRPTTGETELCLANLGHGPVRLLGFPTVADERARTLRAGGKTGPIALDYYRTGSETALALAPTVARRFGFGKTGVVGSWTLWATLAVVVAAWVVAAMALRQESTP